MEAIIEKIKVLDSIVTTPKRVLQPADSKKLSFSKKNSPSSFNIPMPHNYIWI